MNLPKSVQNYAEHEESAQQQDTVDVDIVIVTWNCADVLAPCLQALAECERIQAHVYLVDNASTDGVDDVVNRYSDALDLTFIPLDENVGFARASNIGSLAGSADYVLMLNPDTEVSPTCIIQCVDVLTNRPDVGVVGPCIRFPSGQVQPECARGLPTLWSMFCESLYLHMLFRRSRIFNPIGLGPWDRRESRSVPCILGAFMVLGRPLWEELGGFSEDVFMYYEDIDLCARIREHGYLVWYLGEAEMTHHAGVSSGRSTRNFDLLIGETRWRFMLDHRGRWAAIGAIMMIGWYAVVRLVLAPMREMLDDEGTYSERLARQWDTSKGLLRWVMVRLRYGDRAKWMT